MCDLAGQLMVRGREAKLIKLDAKDAPYAFLDLPWKEALQAFVERIPTRTNELQRLLKEYAKRSDAARRLALEQIQQFVKDRLAKAIADGGTYSQFAQDLQDGSQSLGITANDPAYLRMVFRTNILSAYGAGKFRAATDPDVIEEMPYVQYRTVGDARVRPEHAILDRTIYHAASAEWHRIAPPNSFNCRCSLVSLSRDDVKGKTILGQVPQGYVATPEFDAPPVALIKAKATRGVDAPADPIEVKPGWEDTPPSNDVRQMSIFQLFDPNEARAPDGKWTKGGFAGIGKSKASEAKSADVAAPAKKRRRKTAADAIAEIKARLAKKQQAKEARKAAKAAKTPAKPSEEKMAKAKAVITKHAAAAKAKPKPASPPASEHAQANQKKSPNAATKAAAKQKLQEAIAPAAKQKAAAKAEAAKKKADAAKQKHDEKIKKLAEKIKEHQAKAAAKAEAKKQKQDEKERAALAKAKAKEEAVAKKAKQSAGELKSVHKQSTAALASGDQKHIADALKKAKATKPPATAKLTTKVAHANVTAALAQAAKTHATHNSNAKFGLAGKSSLSQHALHAEVAKQLAKRSIRGAKNEVLRYVSPNDEHAAFKWADRWQNESTDASANAAFTSVQQHSGWGNAQYHATQALLEHDIEAMKHSGLIDADGYVTLYRGVQGKQAEDIRKASKSGKASMKVRKASSWSSDKIVAHKFASGGVVVRAKIHYSRAFAVHKYENQFSLWGNEGEWVMLQEHGAFSVEMVADHGPKHG